MNDNDKKTVLYFPNREEYKKPLGAVKVGEPVRLNLMFSRPSNPAEVFLVLTKDGEQDVYYPMSYVTTNINGMMEYTVTFTVTTRGLYFYRYIINTEEHQYRIAGDEDLNALLGKGTDWQLTVYDEDYKEPEWLEGGMMYQIFVDRFNIGGERRKTKSDVVYRDDWGGVPEYRPDANGKILNNDFFGGNIKGITKKLAYLKSLGVTCIYLNPIFEAHSNHKYDTGNYRKVDPDFGTADDLKELIKKADKKGMKVLLDGVFSHTGDDSIYFNKYGKYDSVGAYQSKDSAYAGWYTFAEFPDKYNSWWGIDILPEVNEQNPAYDEYINGEDGIIRYWTEMGIGGWRFDVADELPDKFLDRAVHAAKSVNPDALMLGEVWEDASNKIAYSTRRRYLQGGQLDSVTNYPFKSDILNFCLSGDGAKLNNTVNFILNNYPKRVVDNLMNLLDTHDTARLLTVLGDSGDTSTREKRANAKLTNLDEAVKRLKIAVTLQYMLPGVPCVYYGDEAGLEGFEDPFNRRCMPWDGKNKEIFRFYKKMGAIRTSEKNILAKGEYRRLLAGDGVYAFTRDNGVEKLYVIANNSGKPLEFMPKDVRRASLTNLMTLKEYDGVVQSDTAVILKRTADVIFPEKKPKKK